MLEIDAENAADYLRGSGRAGPHERLTARELTGGVSNIVLLVEREEGEAFVLKQAREKLRVKSDWRCGVERIFAEIDTLRECGRALEDGPKRSPLALAVPRLLFEDRANLLYGMSAAPPHRVWKEMLLAGKHDSLVAAAAGEMLGRIHAHTWDDDDVRERFDDLQYFEALRLDPYFRHVARRQAEFRPPLLRLIDSLGENRRCLVHGDFSPKNLLVAEGALWLLDFEVGHYGDPAFDIGFFLAHLLLKAARAAPAHQPVLRLAAAFLAAYEMEISATVPGEELESLVARAARNLAGCTVARLLGKSTINYLPEPARRAAVLRMAGELFTRYEECPS